MNKRCCRCCGGRGKELKFGVRVGIPGALRPESAGPWPSENRLRFRKSAGFVRPGMCTTRYWPSGTRRAGALVPPAPAGAAGGGPRAQDAAPVPPRQALRAAHRQRQFAVAAAKKKKSCSILLESKKKNRKWILTTLSPFWEELYSQYAVSRRSCICIGQNALLTFKSGFCCSICWDPFCSGYISCMKELWQLGPCPYWRSVHDCISLH